MSTGAMVWVPKARAAMAWRLHRGRVFVDLWDVEKFYHCENCDPLRAERLKRMNLSQTILPSVTCRCEAAV